MGVNFWSHWGRIGAFCKRFIWIYLKLRQIFRLRRLLWFWHKKRCFCIWPYYSYLGNPKFQRSLTPCPAKSHIRSLRRLIIPIWRTIKWGFAQWSLNFQYINWVMKAGTDWRCASSTQTAPEQCGQWWYTHNMGRYGWVRAFKRHVLIQHKNLKVVGSSNKWGKP